MSHQFVPMPWKCVPMSKWKFISWSFYFITIHVFILICSKCMSYNKIYLFLDHGIFTIYIICLIKILFLINWFSVLEKETPFKYGMEKSFYSYNEASWLNSKQFHLIICGWFFSRVRLLLFFENYFTSNKTNLVWMQNYYIYCLLILIFLF